MAIKVALALFSSATGSGGIDKSDVSPTQVSIFLMSLKKINFFSSQNLSKELHTNLFSNEMESNQDITTSCFP